MADVRDGRLDCAVAALSDGAPPGIAAEDLGAGSYVCAVRPDDPLARRPSVTLRQLGDRPLACLPRGTACRRTLEAGAARAGVRLDVAFEAGDPATLAALAERGLAAAVVPDGIAALRDGRLVGVRVTRPSLQGRLALCWRSIGAPSPAARAFVAHARATLATAPGR